MTESQQRRKMLFSKYVHLRFEFAFFFFFGATAAAAESCMLKFGCFSFWKTVINLTVE